MKLFKKKKYSSLPDEELMALFVKGDKTAFEQLFNRYQQSIFRYFYRMLGYQEQKANDFTQDLFLKVIEKGDSFDLEKKFSTWIYAIALNMIKNEYRRISRQPVIEVYPEEEQEGDWILDWKKMDQPRFKAALEKALAQLDEPHRNCYVLRFQEELSIKEIAALMECPEGTVKSRLYYAFRKVVWNMKNQLFSS